MGGSELQPFPVSHMLSEEKEKEGEVEVGIPFGLDLWIPIYGMQDNDVHCSGKVAKELRMGFAVRKV